MKAKGVRHQMESDGIEWMRNDDHLIEEEGYMQVQAGCRACWPW